MPFEDTNHRGIWAGATKDLCKYILDCNHSDTSNLVVLFHNNSLDFMRLARQLRMAFPLWVDTVIVFLL